MNPENGRGDRLPLRRFHETHDFTDELAEERRSMTPEAWELAESIYAIRMKVHELIDFIEEAFLVQSGPEDQDNDGRWDAIQQARKILRTLPVQSRVLAEKEIYDLAMQHGDIDPSPEKREQYFRDHPSARP